MLPTITWKDGCVVMIDQRKLPMEEVYIDCCDVEQVAESIEAMVIRGAPAIGVAAAYGVALGVRAVIDEAGLDKAFRQIIGRLKRTRPTARNLFWALEKMKSEYKEHRSLGLYGLQEKLLNAALRIDAEDVEMCRLIGEHGKALISSGATILTHCNAGALATAGYGTALGVIRSAYAQHRNILVYADETRPFLQGARLTCWELAGDGIPVTLITDNMSGHLMKKGEITVVITGADRITQNGDTANKIGTYMVAVLARRHDIPFYVAAPLNTIDFSLKEGSQIPIEERHPEEVRRFGECQVTKADMPVRNPAFDVTPAELITAIITEHGIARPPYDQSLEELRLRSIPARPHY